MAVFCSHFNGFLNKGSRIVKLFVFNVFNPPARHFGGRVEDK